MPDMTQAYFAVLESCTEQCRTMLSLEQEKRQALLSNDEPRVTAMLQAQQAALMQLDSLEKKREAEQQAAGFGGKTAEEMANVLSGPQRERLLTATQELRALAQELRELNELSVGIAKDNLRMMEYISKPQRMDEAHGVYKPGAKQTDWRPEPAFEEKI